MSQSSYIAAFLIVGFIVFITMRGELSQYLDALGLGKNSSNGITTDAQGRTFDSSGREVF